MVRVWIVSVVVAVAQAEGFTIRKSMVNLDGWIVSTVRRCAREKDVPRDAVGRLRRRGIIREHFLHRGVKGEAGCVVYTSRGEIDRNCMRHA